MREDPLPLSCKLRLEYGAIALLVMALPTVHTYWEDLSALNESHVFEGEKSFASQQCGDCLCVAVCSTLKHDGGAMFVEASKQDRGTGIPQRLV